MFKERDKGWVMIFEDLVKDQRELAKIILRLRPLLFCQFSHEQSPHLFSQLALHTTPHHTYYACTKDGGIQIAQTIFFTERCPVSNNCPQVCCKGQLTKAKDPTTCKPLLFPCSYVPFDPRGRWVVVLGKAKRAKQVLCQSSACDRAALESIFSSTHPPDTHPPDTPTHLPLPPC